MDRKLGWDGVEMAGDTTQTVGDCVVHGLKEMYRAQVLCDASIIAEGRCFPCHRFLMNILSLKNCLGIYTLAFAHNKQDLLQAALPYISHNLSQLSEEEAFHHLDLQTLISIIASDSLIVSSELAVYRAAHCWWNCQPEDRRPCFRELMQYIRIPLLTSRELSEVKEDMSDATDDEIAMLHTSKEERSQRSLPPLRQGMYCEKIACVDLQVREDPNLRDQDFYVDCYDPLSGEWERLAALKSLMCPGCLAIGNMLYIAGGTHQDDSISDTLHEYNSVTNKWLQLASMSVPRSMHGFLTCKQKLFAIGGWNGSSLLAIAECFDLKQREWTPISRLPLALQLFSSAVLKSKLYLIGGETLEDGHHQNHQGLLIYDTESDTWAQLPLGIVSISAGAVATDNGIYVIGGYCLGKPRPRSQNPFVTPELCATARCFFIKEDGGIGKDSVIPPLPEKIAAAGVVRWKRRVYVFGGENGFRFYKAIYYWEPGDNSWTKCRAKLPISYGGVSQFGCTTLNVPNPHIRSLI
ncbi:kelch-like protein 24 isoform X2 [Microcaecilia unicolor]|uniref:Kelch-like protein 24 isoform X2 n=1 Tax=Microcaecilia unicolor TaxID=1415580 RepID=A0A6P7ZN12_9AMPH|nr:kelch-like protein 24 isoform X2 [Microcaecilia unicolor]